MIAAIGAWIAGAAGSVWARIQFWLLALVAIAVAIGVAFLKGRSSGKQVIIDEQKQQRADAVVERKQSDEKVDAAPSADVDTKLDKWMRD